MKSPSTSSSAKTGSKKTVQSSKDMDMYQVIECSGIYELEIEVRNSLAERWRPTGGICTFMSQYEGRVYMQSMVKYSKK